MMSIQGYDEAAVEVLDILDNTNKEDFEKIPKSFIKFLVDNASLDYKVNFDHSIPISELNTKEKTQEILGYIYINWWCEKNAKEEYKRKIEEYEIRKEEALRERYNPNKIFENRIEKGYGREADNTSKENENMAMVKYNKENILQKIINKILVLLKGRK